MAPRSLAAVALALVLTAGGAAALGEILQPGERLLVGGGLCTMAFVFDGEGAQAGNVYILTAAHCVTLGQRVGSFAGEFGTVVFRGGWQDTGNCGSPLSEDYALILVDDDKKHRAVAAMKGHPHMPTGYTKPEETRSLDLIQYSGYGTGWTAHNLTREQRVGILATDDTQRWSTWNTMATPGDSGGPAAHIATGKALGIVNCVGVGNSGVTVQHVLARADQAGLSVRLRTV